MIKHISITKYIMIYNPLQATGPASKPKLRTDCGD